MWGMELSSPTVFDHVSGIMYTASNARVLANISYVEAFKASIEPLHCWQSKDTFRTLVQLVPQGRLDFTTYPEKLTVADIPSNMINGVLCALCREIGRKVRTLCILGSFVFNCNNVQENLNRYFSQCIHTTYTSKEHKALYTSLPNQSDT